VLGTGSELAKGLAKIYIVGCKYLLGSLTALVVLSLKDLEFLESDPKLLLHLAKTVYSATPPTDQAFKEYFVATLEQCYQNCEGDFPNARVDQCLEEGGQLAVDIHQAQRRYSAFKAGFNVGKVYSFNLDRNDG